MEQVHIEGTVDVEPAPNKATVYFGEKQVAIHYGGEVSTLDLDPDGNLLWDTENIAPYHNADLLGGAVELMNIRDRMHEV